MNKPFAIVNGLYNLFETSTNELGKKFYVTTQLSDDAKSLYPNISEDTIFYIKTDMLDSSIGYNGLYVYTHNNLISNYENDNEFIQTGLINSTLNESKVFLIGNINPISINTPWSVSFHLEAYSLLSSFNSEFDVNLYGITNGNGSKLVSYTVLNANGEKPPFKYHVFKSDIDSGLFGLCIGDTENNNNPNAIRNIRVIINSHTNCTIEPIDPVEVMPTLDECTVIPADKTGFVTENAESGHIYNASADSLAEGVKTEFVIGSETQHLDSPVANGTRSHAEGASIEINAFSNCSWPVNGDYTKFTCDIQQDELYKAQITGLIGTNIVWNNIKRTFVSIEFITNNNQEIGLITINEPFSESPETEQEILIRTGITNGMASHIEGANYIGEDGILSHAEGMGNIISAALSHVEGENNIVIGQLSHVEGVYNLSKSQQSHIEGSNNTANGNYSHIEGSNNTTYGNYSHIEGGYNTTHVWYEHAEGFYNKSNGLPNDAFNHNYVELGLPSGTQWASCNIGAEMETDYGQYFAWGETLTKTYYDWEDPNDSNQNYKYANGAYNKLTKYCYDEDYGYTDNLTILKSNDDAANLLWGGLWKIPTVKDCQELINNCTITAITVGSVNCLQFTSNLNGNYIIIPCSGYYERSQTQGTGSFAMIWTSSLFESNIPSSSYVVNAIFENESAGTYPSGRSVGIPIRPVFNPSAMTIHSIGNGSDSERRNIFEVMHNGDAYLYGVGHYDGTGIKNGPGAQPGVKTIQESIVTSSSITAATTVGYITKNTNIPAGTSIDDLVNMIFNPVLGVNVQLPTISITSSPTTRRCEIGEQITVNLSNTYSDGKFIPVDNWGPSINAGCTVSGDPVYYRNGITLSGSTDVQQCTSLGLNYYVTQDYNQSTTIPKNNKGEDLPDVIVNETATSSTITFPASYKYFVGGTTSLTSTSGQQIRLLDSSGFITTNTVSIPGEIEINKNQYMIIACPSTYKLLNVDGGMAGISITNDFNSSYGINGIALDGNNSYVVYYLYNNGDNAKFLNIKIDKKTL